jgi:hypothetical protein
MRFPFLYVLRVQTKAQKRCFAAMNPMAIFIMGSGVMADWLVLRGQITGSMQVELHLRPSIPGLSQDSAGKFA